MHHEDNTMWIWSAWSDIRLVTDSESSYKDLRKMKSKYKYINTDTQAEKIKDLDNRDEKIKKNIKTHLTILGRMMNLIPKTLFQKHST